MSQKHTTAEQFSALVEFLKENSGLAKGILNAPEYKAKSSMLWEDITNKLNVLGPPIKSQAGWKKVWKDFKYHIKSKLRLNQKAIHGTGGGPNKKYVFSALEEDIIVLLDLRTQESGLKVRKFGVLVENREPSREPLKENNQSFRRSFSPETTALILESENILSFRQSHENECLEEEEQMHAQAEEQEGEPVCEEIRTPRQTRTSVKTAKKLLELQVQQQKSYQEQSVQLLEEQNKLLEKQNRELKAQTEEMKKVRRIKEEKVKILKRHNELMLRESVEKRKLKVLELEIKRKKLNLKELEMHQ